MNELDDTLMELFAANEPDADSDAFTAAVRRRVAARRRLAKAGNFGLVAAIAVAASALVILAPEAVLYPVNLLPRLVGPQVAAAVFLLGAVGLSWWSRFGHT